MKKTLLSSSLVSLLALAACGSPADPSQTLTMKGSDTAVIMFSSLAEEFSAKHPDARISVAGGGGNVGMVALLNGEVEVATTTRAIDETEKKKALDKGMDIREFVSATDGITVIVHPSNPLRKLTIEQVGSLFSGKVKNWKEVGGADMPVALYGRQSAAATFTFFRSVVVKGDFSPDMKQLEGDEAIIGNVMQNAGGIGYVGVGWMRDQQGNPRTEFVGLQLPSTKSRSTYVSSLDEAAVLSGAYPIARPIFQYMDGVPAKDSLLGKFLTYQMTEEAFATIKKTGFYRPTDKDMTKNRAFLNLMQ